MCVPFSVRRQGLSLPPQFLKSTSQPPSLTSPASRLRRWEDDGRCRVLGRRPYTWRHACFFFLFLLFLRGSPYCRLRSLPRRYKICIPTPNPSTWTHVETCFSEESTTPRVVEETSALVGGIERARDRWMSRCLARQGRYETGDSYTLTDDFFIVCQVSRSQSRFCIGSTSRSSRTGSETCKPGMLGRSCRKLSSLTGSDDVRDKENTGDPSL